MPETTPDLTPATDRLLEVCFRVTDDQLDGPTPCEGRTVSQLVGHVVGLVAAFRAAADKELGPWTDTNPDAGGWQDADADWRTTLAERLPALVESWANPEAWEGMTRAGGQDLPGQVAGLVALSEVTLHGWDVARATGQDYACDDATAHTLEGFLGQFDAGGTPGLYAAVVPLENPADASSFDRALAGSGRDPRWAAALGDSLVVTTRGSVRSSARESARESREPPSTGGRPDQVNTGRTVP